MGLLYASDASREFNSREVPVLNLQKIPEKKGFAVLNFKNSGTSEKVGFFCLNDTTVDS